MFYQISSFQNFQTNLDQEWHDNMAEIAKNAFFYLKNGAAKFKSPNSNLKNSNLKNSNLSNHFSKFKLAPFETAFLIYYLIFSTYLISSCFCCCWYAERNWKGMCVVSGTAEKKKNIDKLKESAMYTHTYTDTERSKDT